MAKKVITAPRPLELSHKPHEGYLGYPGQTTWLDAARLFPRVRIACGRQVGKSTFATFLLLEDMAHFKKTWGSGGEYVAAYAAQGHPQASARYDSDLQTFESAGLVKRARDKGQDRWIKLHGIGEADAATIYYWSFDAEAHMSAQGKSLHRGILDEASLVPHEAYTLTLVPMFNTTWGRDVVMGTPILGGVGFHWFEDEFKKGIPRTKERLKTHISFSAPSECNPHSWRLNPETGLMYCKISAEGRPACRTRDEELCLYDGKFAMNTGSVFSNLDAVFTLPYTLDGPLAWSEKPDPSAVYIAGIDLGKHDDYSVVSIFRLDSNSQVALLRVKGDYMAQLAAISHLLGSYSPSQIYAEGREAGTMMTELLRQRFGQRVIAVKWSRGGRWDKESSIVRGQDLFQSAGWRLINIPWQREEFRLFSKYPIGGADKAAADVGIIQARSGWRYEAPPGDHDDAVAANLYAAYGLPLVAPTLPHPESAPEPGSIEFWEWLENSQRLRGPRGSFSLRRRRGF